MFLAAARRVVRHAPRCVVAPGGLRSPGVAPALGAVRNLHLDGFFSDPLFVPVLGDPTAEPPALHSAMALVAEWGPDGAYPETVELPPPDAAGPGMYAIKRTFQPSLIRRKRKHGFLKRLRNRHGRKILQRRRAKNRLRMSC